MRIILSSARQETAKPSHRGGLLSNGGRNVVTTIRVSLNYFNIRVCYTVQSNFAVMIFCLYIDCGHLCFLSFHEWFWNLVPLQSLSEKEGEGSKYTCYIGTSPLANPSRQAKTSQHAGKYSENSLNMKDTKTIIPVCNTAGR